MKAKASFPTIEEPLVFSEAAEDLSECCAGTILGGTERSVAIVLGNFQTQCVELSTDSSWLSPALSNTFSDLLSAFGDLYL